MDRQFIYLLKQAIPGSWLTSILSLVWVQKASPERGPHLGCHNSGWNRCICSSHHATTAALASLRLGRMRSKSKNHRVLYGLQNYWHFPNLLKWLLIIGNCILPRRNIRNTVTPFNCFWSRNTILSGCQVQGTSQMGPCWWPSFFLFSFSNEVISRMWTTRILPN